MSNYLLNKDHLKNAIISAFDDNPLMLNFAKFNHRTYYFARKNGEVIDYVKIQVNFSKGTFWCFMVTTKNNKMKRGYVFNDENNRAEYFINPETKEERFPRNILYTFESNPESLRTAFGKLIKDLTTNGEIFFRKSHLELQE